MCTFVIHSLTCRCSHSVLIVDHVAINHADAAQRREAAAMPLRPHPSPALLSPAQPPQRPQQSHYHPKLCRLRPRHWWQRRPRRRGHLWSSRSPPSTATTGCRFTARCVHSVSILHILFCCLIRVCRFENDTVLGCNHRSCSYAFIRDVSHHIQQHVFVCSCTA